MPMKSVLIFLLSVMAIVTACLAQPQISTNPKEAALVTAIHENNRSLVQKLLKEDKNLIFMKTQSNESVLHVAAQFGDDKVFKLLLDAGADINVMNNRRSKPIHMTTMFGKKEMTEMLLQKGASLREMNAFGLYPIQYAVDSGNIPLVELLIARGEKYSEISRQNATLLHFAAGSGSIPMYEFIASKGLDHNAVDSQGNTMIHHASTSNVDMVKYLIAKGFDMRALNGWGMIPAVTSGFWNKKDILLYYLTNGIAINEKFGPENNTLLHVIAGFGSPDMTMFLLDNGADVNSINGANETALALAIMSNKFDTVKLLFERGAEINPGICKDGTTCSSDIRIPLHMAALTNVVLTTFLLDNGADINAVDAMGDTALANAIYRNKPDIVKVLIDRGIKTDTVNIQMDTPLHIAVERGNRDIVKMLLSKKVNINAKNSKGNTPLHFAAAAGYDDIAMLLLENGSNVTLKDNAKHTPYYYADYFDNENVKTILVNNKSKTNDRDKKKEQIEKHFFNNGEAVVWFMGHSGWAVKTKNNLMIFDYVEDGRSADVKSLFNGGVNADELKDLNVTVFVSHTHEDHYSQVINSWKDVVKHITYVFGFDDPNAKVPYTKILPRETKNIGTVTVTAIFSNDSGVGFVAEADGIVLFHSGDHANRNRDLSGNYCPEIDYIASLNKKVDIAFLPVSGCNFGDVEAVKIGDFYTIHTLNPALVVPMHGNPSSFEPFATAFKEKKMKNLLFVPTGKGDRVLYTSKKQ